MDSDLIGVLDCLDGDMGCMSGAGINNTLSFSLHLLTIFQGWTGLMQLSISLACPSLAFM
jgi:hypothetical protein